MRCQTNDKQKTFEMNNFIFLYTINVTNYNLYKKLFQIRFTELGQIRFFFPVIIKFPVQGNKGSSG